MHQILHYGIKQNAIIKEKLRSSSFISMSVKEDFPLRYPGETLMSQNYVTYFTNNKYAEKLQK